MNAFTLAETPLSQLPVRLRLPVFCLSISALLWTWAARFPHLDPIGKEWAADARRYLEAGQ